MKRLFASSGIISARELTRRFGTATPVDRLSFDVLPGRVTGFVGPNGAGKSTTMRILVGLDTQATGRALIAGKPYRDHVRPLTVVGALLDAGAVHPGRTARNHLRWLAATNRLSTRRVGEVLAHAGLDAVADHRLGTYSLGMRQRLGVAGALLGDPAVLILDEPMNGLDPEGIRWMRTLLTRLAAEGRTIFLSSHLIGELALVADHLVVVGRGRLLADTSIADLLRFGSSDSLEDVYLRLTEAATEYRTSDLTSSRGAQES